MQVKLLVAGGLGLLIPGTTSDLVGVVLILAVYFFHLRRRKGARPPTAAAE